VERSFKKLNTKIKKARKAYQKLVEPNILDSIELAPIDITPVGQPIPTSDKETKGSHDHI
jgi:hypothetical protein